MSDSLNMPGKNNLYAAIGLSPSRIRMRPNTGHEMGSAVGTFISPRTGEAVRVLARTGESPSAAMRRVQLHHSR